MFQGWKERAITQACHVLRVLSGRKIKHAPSNFLDLATQTFYDKRTWHDNSINNQFKVYLDKNV